MKKDQVIDVRITTKEKELIKRKNINVSALFREALWKETSLTKEQCELHMAKKISDALGMEVISFVLFPHTRDYQEAVLRFAPFRARDDDKA